MLFSSLLCISDLSPPVIVSCPSNMSISTDPNKPTANVSWPQVQAIDNVEVESVIGTEDSGTAFPVSLTLVTYTAIDTAGNIDQDNCSFYIEVSGEVISVHVSLLQWPWQSLNALKLLIQKHCRCKMHQMSLSSFIP